MDKANEVQGRTIAIISYLTLVGTLIALSMNQDPKFPFARFHTRQAFGIHLFFHGFALFLSQWFDFLGIMILYTFFLILWLIGFSGALAGKYTPIPLAGPYFQKWFTFIP